MTKTLVKEKVIKVGDTVPDFEALDEHGKKITPGQFTEKILVLYFYPKDNTPGCTKESCSFRNRFSTFKKKNISILGISKDSQKSHLNFIEKYDLPFTLISDTDKKVQKLFGVWQEKIMYGKKTMGTVRTTFIIGKDKKIAYIFEKVTCENHAEEVLEKLEELGFG